MSEKLRIVLATSDGLRHRYAAATLSAGLDLVGVVSEAKAPPAAILPCEPADRDVIVRHFAERDQADHRFLGAALAFPRVDLLRLPMGGINAPEVAEWIIRLEPDFLVLFGVSMVKPPLLDQYRGRMVNVHLGLSPYYRGSGANFWPLVERVPECVGATIHLAVARVDAGAILAQLRPEPDPADRAHELGAKTIVAAFQAFPRVLQRYAAGQLVPREQQLGAGRVFRRADFRAAVVRSMWAQFATGMMAEYLADAKRRRAAYPIVPLEN